MTIFPQNTFHEEFLGYKLLKVVLHMVIVNGWNSVTEEIGKRLE